MKTTLTILALLLTTSIFGQYRTEKALIEQLKSGQLSVESYSDMALSVLENRSDSVRIEFVKPHYFDNDDLIAGMGGAALASLSYTIDIEKLFKK